MKKALESFFRWFQSVFGPKYKTHWGPAPGKDIDCNDPSGCPTPAAFARAEQAFKAEYPDDTLSGIRIKWNADGTYLTTWGYKPSDKVTGTHNRHWIECTNWGSWVHERIHMYHESKKIPTGHPGGKWMRAEDTAKEARLKALLRAEFGRN